jgi:hypothetical protein
VPQSLWPEINIETEIVTDYGRRPPVAQRERERHRIASQIQHRVGAQILVVGRAPACGATVAALIRRDDVVTELSERNHDLAPAVGEFGKSVQKEQQGLARLLQAGLEDMHAKAVDAIDETGVHAGR